MATDSKVPPYPDMPPPSRPGRRPDSETAEDRIYRDVSFASSDYIPWVFGKLRLGNANLSRMQSSGVPVLRSHDGNQQIGDVTTVRKDNSTGVWHSDWRLPKIAPNRRTFEQLDAGLMRGISVGGKLIYASIVVDNPDPVDDFDDLLLTADWELIEQSLTPIPADVAAGIDRTADAFLFRDGQLFDLLIGLDNIRTPESTALRTHVDRLMRQHNQNVTIRRRESAMANQNTIQDIPTELIERAIAAQLERSESMKALTDVPGKIDKLMADTAAEEARNMEYRAKLDTLQFQPGGLVLQHGNWKASDPVLDMGKVMRLTQTSDAGFPQLDRANTTLEESCLERITLGQPGRNVVARIPFEALRMLGEQLDLQRSTLSDGAGIRGLQTDYLGDGGLILNAWSPILARCDVRFGVSGTQKAPWATAQMTALPGVEGADIPATSLTLNDVGYLPKSFASAYTISSSLRAADDGMFEEISRRAIGDILLDVVTAEVLFGDGGDGFTGIWDKTGVPNHDYGAAQTNFDREDVLDWLDAVRLAKTDGMRYTVVMGDGLWKLCERTPRGIDGTSSAGFTEISMYMLETLTRPHEGMIEREMAFHYADFAPTGTDDAGLFFKADRVIVWMWGDSLNLELVPQLARQDAFKMVAECNMEAYRPEQNASRIKRT